MRELALDPLPGIATDPLAAMRKAAGKDALKGNRAVQVATSGDNGDDTADIDPISTTSLPRRVCASRRRSATPTWISRLLTDCTGSAPCTSPRSPLRGSGPSPSERVTERAARSRVKAGSRSSPRPSAESRAASRATASVRRDAGRSAPPRTRDDGCVAWPEAIVMIDDFAVPADPGYGFDDYGPVVGALTQAERSGHRIYAQFHAPAQSDAAGSGAPSQ